MGPLDFWILMIILIIIAHKVGKDKGYTSGKRLGSTERYLCGYKKGNRDAYTDILSLKNLDDEEIVSKVKKMCDKIEKEK